MTKSGRETPQATKVLAVASSGGHWVQLMRLVPAWVGLDVAYVTTEPEYRKVADAMHSELGAVAPRFYVVVAANRWQKLRVAKLLAQLVWIIVRERPDAVVTTGAAPGLLALQAARLVGARTVWVDSVANAEQMSLAGRGARHSADAWLTQWQDVAKSTVIRGRSPEYWGSVL
jgi:UDP-N-acetylglucosamine:LPS N-acetylglucosamine transferase